MELLVLRIIFHSVDEIDDHRNVDDKDDNSADANVLDDLIYFKRDERCGGDDGEVFGPPFFEQQPNAFSSQQRGIEKTSGANRFELAIIEEAEFHYQSVNVMIVVVNVQHAEKVYQRAGNIFVEQ